MNRSTDPLFDSRIADWFEGDPNRAPGQVLDTVLAAVPSISQRRRLLVPWRFRLMTNSVRAAGAVAIVAIVGVGVLAVVFRFPGIGSPRPTTTLSPAPTPVAPGIDAWTTYTSEIHGINLGFPEDWSLLAAAMREWQVGDEFPSDSPPYADTFVSPEAGDAQIGLFVWEMPAGDGVDVDSVPSLTTWAETFCVDVGVSSCEGFTDRAVSMCLNAGGDSCRAAVLVPTSGAQYAFFMDWTSAMFTGIPDLIRVVVVAREDAFPTSARYGGSVALLKSILTTMDVSTP